VTPAEDAEDAEEVEDAGELEETDDSGAPEPDEPEPYTIDELAAHTRIPSRTIRFYQSSGVLPKPQKRGRIAYYGPSHVERLELIGRMQDRGLRMRAIKDLFDRIDRGEVVLSEWLGLEEQLSSAWVDDAPEVVDREGLEQLVGPDRRPGLIAELSRTGLIEAQAEGAYLVPSPGLLKVALALDDGEVGLEVAAGANAILQKHLGRAAGELAQHFAAHAGDGFGAHNSVAALTEAFRELRSHGLEAVRLIFAREMEQVLRKMIESGEAARIEKKKRSKRKRKG
jgi:DNA-binding transcriptional MerR regulator